MAPNRECALSENLFARIKDRSLKKEFRRRRKFKPEVLTVEEFWPMVDSFPDQVRNPSIACFFGGFRRGELSECRWGNVDQKQSRVVFDADETKEADAKTVYYDAELDPILDKLEIEYIASGFQDGVVFRNEHGGRLRADAFTHLVRSYCDLYAEKTGIDKYRRITPHSFRRSYRTRKDREGADRRAVAANMGHHSLTTSEIYNVVDEERQRSVAGHLNIVGDGLRAQIGALIETARKEGIGLVDLQTEMRLLWRSAEKMPAR